MIVFAIVIITGIYVLIKLARSDMAVPANAERYISPRSRAYVQAIIDLGKHDYSWPGMPAEMRVRYILGR